MKWGTLILFLILNNVPSDDLKFWVKINFKINSRKITDSDFITIKYDGDQPLRPYRAFPFLRMRMNLDSDLGLYYEKIE